MEVKRVITVYAEATPNPAALKFVSNRMIYNGWVEYNTVRDAYQSPFATQLFEFSCVKSIFISQNFVTITKTDDTVWEDVMNILREFIKSYLQEENTIFEVMPTPIVMKQAQASNPLTDKENEQIAAQIEAVLDEYVKPAVEQDGGAIYFQSFKDGVVSVLLKGSCSGCPSSTVTLKAGIENLLKRMVPEVTEVVQVF